MKKITLLSLFLLFTCPILKASDYNCKTNNPGAPPLLVLLDHLFHDYEIMGADYSEALGDFELSTIEANEISEPLTQILKDQNIDIHNGKIIEVTIYKFTSGPYENYTFYKLTNSFGRSNISFFHGAEKTYLCKQK